MHTSRNLKRNGHQSTHDVNEKDESDEIHFDSQDTNFKCHTLRIRICPEWSLFHTIIKHVFLLVIIFACPFLPKCSIQSTPWKALARMCQGFQNHWEGFQILANLLSWKNINLTERLYIQRVWKIWKGLIKGLIDGTGWTNGWSEGNGSFPVSGTASLTMQNKQSQSMASYHMDLTTQSGQ